MSASRYVHLAKLLLMLELRAKERVLTPMLLALTLILVQAFVFGPLPADFVARVFAATSTVTMLMAVQMSCSRVFEPWERGDAQLWLVMQPLSLIGVFASFTGLACATGFAISVVNSLCASVLLALPSMTLERWLIVGWLNSLALIAMTPVGILLASLTRGVKGRNILYPLLYFPLLAPVLVAYGQGLVIVVEGTHEALWRETKTWFQLLCGFGIMSFILTALFFQEWAEPKLRAEQSP